MSLISVRARKEKLYRSLSPNAGGAALISEDERSLYGVKKLYKSLSPKAGETALISEDEKKSLQVMQKFSAKMKKVCHLSANIELYKLETSDDCLMKGET